MIPCSSCTLDCDFRPGQIASKFILRQQLDAVIEGMTPGLKGCCGGSFWWLREKSIEGEDRFVLMLEELSQSDIPLAVAGAKFRWCQGFLDNPSGYRSRN